MKTLVVYDNEGHIISNITGSYRVPVGIPYLEVNIPEGKRIVSGVGVNTGEKPHQVIFEDIPPSEIDLVNGKLVSQEQAIIELTMLITGV